MKLILTLKRITTNNQLLKIASLVFGYSFWIMLAQIQKIDLNLKVPVSFYGLQNNLKVSSAENIEVNLSGRRMDFYNLDISKLAIHINLAHLSSTGSYNINILPENIFLHNKIKLLDYLPSKILIQVSAI